ncbi:hypothetical protein DPMN_177581 [Dreissena polymorpha]|uniref:Uncharacterized protein n=1 Tax=Dreissena polymorpha TaxID=45954 RepID=A0A9D4IJ49_DREPO|nr:hypothetical protein DPMN_177581 [Dreissena polymorpha]
MNQELQGRTGNDRLGIGNNRDCNGNNRDCTVRAPVYLCNVAIQRVCQHSPGLHRGVAVALPDVCLARWSSGAVPVVPGAVPVVPGATPVVTGPTR